MAGFRNFHPLCGLNSLNILEGGTYGVTGDAPPILSSDYDICMELDGQMAACFED